MRFEDPISMTKRLLASLLLLCLCSGCDAFQRPPSNVPTSWHQPGLVITHPNGDGPQVILWGPPEYYCCNYAG